MNTRRTAYPTQSQRDWLQGLAREAHNVASDADWLRASGDESWSTTDLEIRHLPLAATVSTKLAGYQPISGFHKAIVARSLSQGEEPGSEELCYAIAVLQRILARGYPTRLSADVEHALLASIAPQASPELTWADSASIVTNDADWGAGLPRALDIESVAAWRSHTDSEAEKQFFSDVLVDLFGPSVASYAYCQVPLEFLVPDYRGRERVDFLVCGPDLPRPVVFEVDGSQHHQPRQLAIDERRDEQLRAAGLEVLRISLAELPTTEEQKSFCSRWLANLERKDRNTVSRRMECFATDILVFQYLFLDLIATKVGQERVDLLVLSPLPKRVLGLALEEMRSALRHLSDIYGLSLSVPAVGLHVAMDLSEAERVRADCALLLSTEVPANALDVGALTRQLPRADRVWAALSAIGRSPGRIGTRALPPRRASAGAREESYEFFLRWIFWKTRFRELQLPGIRRTLEGHSSIVLLPTGSGKSVVYQLSGLLQLGIVVCLDPLVSLVQDQVRVLREQHLITRTFGFMGGKAQSPRMREEALRRLSEGDIYFAFMTPERLQQDRVQQHLRHAFTNVSIGAVVVDEAHVISEWGHDFRAAYLRVGRVLTDLAGADRPPFLGLTATAARNVLRDIQRQLGITEPDAVISPTRFDRRNLRFVIKRCEAGGVERRLREVVQEVPTRYGLDPKEFWALRGQQTMAGLLFTLTVNGIHGILQRHASLEQAVREAQSMTDVPIGMYSGQMPKEFDRRGDWDQLKDAAATQFTQNRVHSLVSTSAFGMGIDKPNVRFTVHIGLPSGIEAFYQQAGRGGRDGDDCYCYLLFECDDVLVAQLETDNWHLNVGRNFTDLSTHAFFLRQSFPGIDVEIKRAHPVLHFLDLMKGQTAHLVEAAPNGQRRSTPPKGYRMRGAALEVWDCDITYCLASLEKLGLVTDLSFRYAGNMDLHASANVVDRIDRDQIWSHLYEYEYVYDPVQARQLADRVLQLDAETTIEAVYRVWLASRYESILKGRQRSLRELARLAKDEAPDGVLRSAVEEYLSSSVMSSALDRLLESGEVDLERYLDIARECNPAEWQELGLQVGRLLEASPNNPFLLTLRAMMLVQQGEDSFGLARAEFDEAGRALARLRNRDVGNSTEECEQALVAVPSAETIEYLLSDHCQLVRDDVITIIETMPAIEGQSPTRVAAIVSDRAVAQQMARVVEAATAATNEEVRP